MSKKSLLLEAIEILQQILTNFPTACCREDAVIDGCWHCTHCHGCGDSLLTIKHQKGCIFLNVQAFLSKPGVLHHENHLKELINLKQANKELLLSNMHIKKKLYMAEGFLKELGTGINVLATICEVEGLWAGKMRADEMKNDLDIFFEGEGQ